MTKPRIFYVCSYGGCGSKMLCKYLSNFGISVHIHSRNPPNMLEKVNDREWFQKGDKIPNTDIDKFTVIYIYRDVVKSIISRHWHKKNNNSLKKNLRNIETEKKHWYLNNEEFIKSGKDLYGFEEFFNNYLYKKNKNYDIYCVKYEDFFSNIQEFNLTLKIPDNKEKYPICKETKKPFKEDDRKCLVKLYLPLNKKMSNLPFIYINKKNN